MGQSDDLVARECTRHYCEKLGVTPEQFAETVGVAKDRFVNFYNGLSSETAFTGDERTRYGDFVAELIEAETLEENEAKYGLRPRFKTVMDSLQDKFGTKT
jgi:hypothetical protein